MIRRLWFMCHEQLPVGCTKYEEVVKESRSMKGSGTHRGHQVHYFQKVVVSRSSVICTIKKGHHRPFNTQNKINLSAKTQQSRRRASFSNL